MRSYHQSFNSHQTNFLLITSLISYYSFICSVFFFSVATKSHKRRGRKTFIVWTLVGFLVECKGTQVQILHPFPLIYTTLWLRLNVGAQVAMDFTFLGYSNNSVLAVVIGTALLKEQHLLKREEFVNLFGRSFPGKIMGKEKFKNFPPHFNFYSILEKT